MGYCPNTCIVLQARSKERAFFGFIEKGENFQLTIHDKGIGLPEGLDADRSTSPGLRIIKELAKQLRGRFEYTTDQEALFTISFPNIPARKRMS